MKHYNKFLAYWFVSGLIAVFIGATQKLGGNINYHYAIFAGLTIEIFVIIFFVYHNYLQLKSFVADMIRH